MTDTLAQPRATEAPAASAPANTIPAPTEPAGPLTRAALFAKRTLKTTPVTVPEWGTALLAPLTQDQFEGLQKRHEGADGTVNTGKGYVAEAIAAALVNPDGTRMFPDEVEGAKEVRQLPLPVSSVLFAVVADISGITKEARQKLGKAFGVTLFGDGSSDSASKS